MTPREELTDHECLTILHSAGIAGHTTPDDAAIIRATARYLATRDAQGEGAVLSEERAKFQRETRRTSALTQLLWRWIERQEALGCSSDQWPKACASCDLMRDTKALLYSPINVDPTPSDASREEGKYLDPMPSEAVNVPEGSGYWRAEQLIKQLIALGVSHDVEHKETSSGDPLTVYTLWLRKSARIRLEEEWS